MSPKTSHGNQLRIGDVFPGLGLTAIDGQEVAVPAGDGRITHLQFRRFAGCPICNLHLRSVTARIDEIEDAGVREVVIFHATDDELRKYQDDMPFAVVGDPDRELYRRFGVEHTARAILDPRSWRAFLPGIVNALRRASSRRRAPLPVAPNGGHLGLPADLLVAPDGTVAAVKYGDHAYDQWTVDEVLSEASNAAAVRGRT
jgi:peroxiredoxin